MTRLPRLLLLVFALTALPALAHAQTAPPAGWPPYLRWNLVPKWIQWDAAKNQPKVDWPQNDGCVANPVDEILPAGTLIDRFGLQTGSYFSPRGASFKSRATPYICKSMDYRVYKVTTNLTVHTCRAAAWFGLIGGAKQYKTDEPAQALADKHIIAEVLYEAAGNNLPYPQCGGP